MTSTRLVFRLIVAGAFALIAAPAAALPPIDLAPVPSKCPPDSVPVGPVCADKFEASVWSIPPLGQSGRVNVALINKIRNGKATLTDLLNVGGIQIAPSASCSGRDWPESFPANGNWTEPLYAVSVPLTQPTACVTWFQAAQACALSGKRLLTNQEWQQAAAGTPDPFPDDGKTTCVTFSPGPASTGFRTDCRSNWGAFDMVGNVWEWVADWVHQSSGTCGLWDDSMGNDFTCFGLRAGDNGVVTPSPKPAALIRGGSWIDGRAGGVFAVTGQFTPDEQLSNIGFRCAR
jgi:formylglycine-generating enzyme required for sulfatase activity